MGRGYICILKHPKHCILVGIYSMCYKISKENLLHIPVHLSRSAQTLDTISRAPAYLTPPDNIRNYFFPQNYFLNQDSVIRVLHEVPESTKPHLSALFLYTSQGGQCHKPGQCVTPCSQSSALKLLGNLFFALKRFPDDSICLPKRDM